MDPLPAGTPRARFARWNMSLRARCAVVLVIPIAALFTMLFAVYSLQGGLRDADRDTSRAYAIRGGLADLRNALLDSEAAIADYLATGQQRYFEHYTSARQSVERILPRAAALVHREAPLAEIRNLATEELAILERLRQPGPTHAETETLRDRERAIMSDLQARIALLSDSEERLFTQSRYQRDLARTQLFRTVIACGVLGPLGALFLHLLLAGSVARRLRAVEENARRLAHGLPLQPLSPATDEIASLGSQLENAAYRMREREGALQISERRYRDLFDHAPIPYEETDLDGRVTRFNAAVCRLLKSSPDQMLGRTAWDFMSPERQGEARADMRRRIREGSESGPIQAEYVLDEGSHLTVEIRENLMRNDRGEVTGVIRSLLDVTERNLADMAARKVGEYAMELRIKNEQLGRALDAARSATVAKSRFLASVSHELRTPLNGIIGFSELLHDGKLGPVTEDQVDVLNDILVSARHLLQLINDILDLSKVEAGRMDFHPERCALATLAMEVRDVVRPLADKKGLHLTLEVPPTLTASIDPGRFKQVLYNYLSNAVKFTAEAGTVALRIAPHGDSEFRLDVEDSGIGISAEELPRLFQEFAQLPNSRHAGQGTGLGLALTRHLVEAQGGSVAVRSELGRGSIFSAILPLVNAATSI